jgi:hypothetical protein
MVQEVTFDQRVWNSLVELVNECTQLSFLHINRCGITHYDPDNWKGMRPFYCIQFSNCTDAEGRYCNRWRGRDVMTKLCLPLLERVHELSVVCGSLWNKADMINLETVNRDY